MAINDNPYALGATLARGNDIPKLTATDLQVLSAPVKTFQGIINTASENFKKDALTNFTNAAGIAEMEGNVDALQGLKQGIFSFNDPESRTKALETFAKVNDNVLGNQLQTEALQASQLGDINAFESVLQRLDKSDVSPKLKFDMRTKLGAQLPDMYGKDALKTVLESVRQTGGSALGADKASREFKQKLLSIPGLSPEKINALDSAAQAGISNLTKLGAQANEAIATAEAQIDSNQENELTKLNATYPGIKALRDSKIKQYVDTQTTSAEDLYSFANKNIEDSGFGSMFVQGSSDVKDKLQSLMDGGYTPYELKIALDRLGSPAYFTQEGKLTVDPSKIKGAVDAYRKNKPALLELTPGEKKYAEEYIQIKNNASALKREVRKTVRRESGLPETYNALESADIKRLITPKTTSDNSLGNSTNKVPTDFSKLSVDQAALKVRLDELDPTGYVSGLADAESSFGANTNNPKSSVKGVFQFLDSTFNELAGKYAGKDGIPKNLDINNPEHQALMALKYKEENLKFLGNLPRQRGLSENAAGRLGHYGPGNAKAILQADDSELLSDVLPPKTIRDNPQFQNKTVGQLLQETNEFFAKSTEVSNKEIADKLRGKKKDAGESAAEDVLKKWRSGTPIMNADLADLDRVFSRYMGTNNLAP